MKNAKSMFLEAVSMLAGGMAIHLTAADPPAPTSQAPNTLVPGGDSTMVTDPGQPGSSGTWQDEIGVNFHKGSMEAGFSLGATVGAHIFGDAETHDFALAKVLVGRVISNELASDKWYRGQWEMLG